MNIIIFMVMKVVVTKMAVSGTNIVHYCSDVDYTDDIIQFYFYLCIYL